MEDFMLLKTFLWFYSYSIENLEKKYKCPNFFPEGCSWLALVDIECLQNSATVELLNVIYPLFILLGNENKNLSPTYITPTLLDHSAKTKAWFTVLFYNSQS